jgi:hypothetical protein
MAVVIFFNLVNFVNIYEKSFGLASNSTMSLSQNNTLLKMFEIENEVKVAIKNIPININYTIGHLQKASNLVDSNLQKELFSLEPRAFNQILSEISDLKIIANTTTLPILVKGTQISEGLSHIVDLIQLLEIDKIENDTEILETLPSFFHC